MFHITDHFTYAPFQFTRLMGKTLFPSTPLPPPPPPPPPPHTHTRSLHSQTFVVVAVLVIVIIIYFQTVSNSRFQQWRRPQSRWKPMTRNVQCVMNCSLTPSCSHAVISCVATVSSAGYSPKPRRTVLFAAVSSWIQRGEPVGKTWRTSLTVFLSDLAMAALVESQQLLSRITRVRPV